MRKALPLLLILFGGGNVFSQTFNWSRHVSVSGPLYSVLGHAVSVDSARNTYATGAFIGTITFPNNCGTFTAGGTNNNAADIFIAKFDPNGTCLWARQYGGGSDDEGFGISVDNVGNVYVTGYFIGSVTFGTKTVNSHGQGDIFVVKLNQNGVVQWAVRGGGMGFDGGRSIAIGTRLYLTGTVSNSTSNVSFDSTSGPACSAANVTSSADIFLVKYNPAGVCQIVKRAGGVNADQGYGVSLDGPGNIYVTGVFKGAASFGAISINGSTSHQNAFVAKFDPALNAQWARSVNGNASSYSISTDSQGNSYIAGEILGTATFAGDQPFSITSAGSADAFIAKCDSTGTFAWARNFGGSGNDAAHSVSVRETCDLFVTGYFRGTANFGGTTLLTSLGGADIFVTRFGTGGLIQWALAAGGSLDDEGRGISVDSFGKASVTGNFKSNSAVFTGTSPLSNPASLTNVFFAKASP